MIRLPHEREMLEAALTGGSPRGLEHMPIYCTFLLRWRIEDWISDLSVKYRHPREEVTEIIVQMGKFINEVYPRAKVTPRVPYFWSVFPVDYLAARCNSATNRAADKLTFVKGLVAKVEDALKRKRHLLGEVPAPSGVSKEPVEIPQAETPPVLKPSDRVSPMRPLEERSQFFSGELVYFLYEAGSRRGQSPQELLVDLGNTALYLDANFPDENVSSLREQLLLKVLAAERASRELDQILSALETQLVDATKVLEKIEILMLSVVGAQE